MLIPHWSNGHHQAHFADVNGDGVSDLLLQANHVDGSSSLILGSNTSGDVRYLSSHQQALPAQLAGSYWDASQAKVTLADFNGDGFADLLLVLPQDQIALTFLSDNKPVELTAQVAQQYSADTLGWLTDASESLEA